MTPTKPHKVAVWIRLRGAEGWGCACMAAVLPKVEDEMLALGLIHSCIDVHQWAYNPDKVDAARALQPLNERQIFGKSIFLFDGVERARLAGLGELHKPSVADLFVATMKGTYA